MSKQRTIGVAGCDIKPGDPLIFVNQEYIEFHESAMRQISDQATEIKDLGQKLDNTRHDLVGLAYWATRAVMPDGDLADETGVAPRVRLGRLVQKARRDHDTLTWGDEDEENA